MREVFVLHPMLRKRSLRFLKYVFVFPETTSDEHMLNRQKIVKNGKSGFNFGKVVFRTPPEVVSSFFFWGGSAGMGC
jgi:hypothetical protein